jgi:hypothetical protein
VSEGFSARSDGLERPTMGQRLTLCLDVGLLIHLDDRSGRRPTTRSARSRSGTCRSPFANCEAARVDHGPGLVRYAQRSRPRAPFRYCLASYGLADSPRRRKANVVPIALCGRRAAVGLHVE